MNNLNELNDILFDTLRGVKSGEIDEKKALAITKVSASIINNGKLQLTAAKFVKGGSIKTGVFGEISAKETSKNLPEGDLYTKKLEYALSMGYANISQAINELGKNGFEQKFKASQK